MTKCAYCEYNDGAVYTSYPPKYRCTVTGEYHLALDDCNVEFAPVKHGRWIVCDDPYKTIDGRVFDGYRECSVCGYTTNSEYWAKTYYKFCPNCGADMREVEE